MQKNMTEQNSPKKVWLVVTGDSGSAKFVQSANASVFATEEGARKALEGVVEENSKYFDADPEWDETRTHASIITGDGDYIIHYMQEQIVQE